MKIARITSQNRRDFYAVYVCEGCGHEYEDYGYDDRYFHDTVVPEKKCPACGKSRNDLGVVGEFVETKYPAGKIV